MSNKISKLISFSYLNQAISMALQLAQVKILTSILSQDNYGGWNQIQTTINFIIVIFTLNLGHGFIRYASSYSKELKEKTFFSVIIFQTGLTFLIILILLPFNKLIMNYFVEKDSILLYMLMGLAAILIISISNIQNFLLVSGKEIQMIRQNLIQVISDVGFTLFGVLIQQDIFGALTGYASSKLFCFLLFSWINKIDFRKISFSIEITKTLLKFGLPLISISIAYWVISSSNRYLINYFIDLGAVGRFSVASSFPMMLVIIFTLLSTIFLSNTSRLFDGGNYERVSYWFSIILRLFFVVGISGGSFLIAANRSLTLIVSNKEYLFDGLPLVYVFVSLGSLAFGGFQIISRLYDLEKKVYQNSINWIFAMILNIILNISLIPFLGIIGAAIATGVTFVVGFLLSMIKRPKQIKIIVPWMKIIILLFTSFASAYLYAIHYETEVSVSVGIMIAVLFALVSFTLSVLFKIIHLNELVSLIKK